MAAEKVIILNDYYDQGAVIVSVRKKTVIIYNTATDATSFSFNIGAADWEEIKKFVDGKLKEK